MSVAASGAAGLAIVVSYLLGSVPFAVVVSRAMGLPDPRSYGSRNPGATNVLRGGGKLAALLTLLGDSGKGALAVGLVWLAAREAWHWGSTASRRHSCKSPWGRRVTGSGASR